jgi:hypothetical protein
MNQQKENDQNPIPTYHLCHNGVLTKPSIHHGKAGRGLTETGNKRVELLGGAHIVIEKQIHQISLIVINGYPEREPSKNLDFFMR